MPDIIEEAQEKEKRPKVLIATKPGVQLKLKEVQWRNGSTARYELRANVKGNKAGSDFNNWESAKPVFDELVEKHGLEVKKEM